jgi:hypothetical protein
VVRHQRGDEMAPHERQLGDAMLGDDNRGCHKSRVMEVKP